MSWVIPKTTDYTLKEGDSGIVVWALQKQCQRRNIDVAADGVFGPGTVEAVKKLQQKLGVAVDGVAGPKTQQTLTRDQTNRLQGLPEDLLWSVSSYESGGYLGAVNWNVAGGVDCGAMQRRVLEKDYHNDAVIQRAFDSGYQVPLAGRTLKDRHDAYVNRPGIWGNDETAWRTAVLYHNYPAMAEKISMVGVGNLSSYYTSPQKWVTVHKLTFPDGFPIVTPLQWGQHYSLGNAAHREPGQAVKLVTDWSV